MAKKDRSSVYIAEYNGFYGLRRDSNASSDGATQGRDE